MSEKFMVWNVQSGGFNGYPDNSNERPEREAGISAFLQARREEGVTTAILVDTFRWDEVHGPVSRLTGESQGIADYTRFKHAFHTQVGGKALKDIGREKVGLSVVTDRKVDSVEAPLVGIDEYQRRALILRMKLAQQTLHLGAINLSDTDADAQHDQMIGLQERVNLTADPDDPRVTAGDFETLTPGGRRELRPSKFSDRVLHRVGSGLLHVAAAVTLPVRTAEGTVGYYAKAFNAINKRAVIPEMVDEFGYERAKSGPTHYFADVPLLGLAHMLTRGVEVTDTYTVGNPNVSNQRAVVVEFEMPKVSSRQ